MTATIAPPDVWCIAGHDGEPTLPGPNIDRCNRKPIEHDLLLAAKAEARVIIAARTLMQWIDGGGKVEPWPNASGLDDLRAALKAHPAGHHYVSAWLPCLHCSAAIRWIAGRYEDSHGNPDGHEPDPRYI